MSRCSTELFDILTNYHFRSDHLDSMSPPCSAASRSLLANSQIHEYVSRTSSTRTYATKT